MMHLFKANPGGVHPDSSKHTAGCPLQKLKNVPRVRIPMSMQIGPPCTACVKVGDKVSIGTKIGEPVAPMAVPIHSSVSGEVVSIKKEMQSNSRECEVVEIKNDRRGTLDPELAPPVVESKEDFINAVRESGLVGLGGAGFPTHFKLNPPPDKKIDRLLINGMECEPYITSDDYQIRHFADEIMEGIRLVMHWCEIPVAIIGMEDNTPEAFEIMKKALDACEWAKGKVSLEQVKTTYPHGAEKVLITELTGRKVPSGGLPHDVGCLVMNVGSVRFVAKYLEDGHPLTEKIITLDGPAMNRTGLYLVPIGTEISDLLDLSGGLCRVPAKVIMGGPMMGVAVSNINSPILKMNNAILVFDEETARIPDEGPCISCGRCSEVCPMQLMPTELDRFARRGDLDRLEDYSVLDCIECGSCTYICPARRFLVQNIRIGKQAVIARNKARAAAAREEKKD